MKYLVMECHPGYAVVLDENGRFLKVANMRYQVGQKVTRVIEMQLPVSSAETKPERKTGRRWLYTLSAAAACLVLVILAIFQTGHETYGSVYLTINPEVRIDVNRRDMVVGLDGMNADGDELIRNYNYSGKSLDLVTDELVDLAIELGYLHEGGRIVLTLDGEDNEWVITRGDALSQQLNEYLTEKITVTIEVTQAGVNGTTETTEGGQEIIIPIEPSGNYGESDYGETTPIKPTENQNATGNAGDSGYGQTDYSNPTGNAQSNQEDSDDGLSDYGDPIDDGQTDYSQPTPPADDGQPNDDDSDDGQSNYGGGDDGQSNYGNGDDDGQSDYSDSDDD